jgi:hypothetical protein
MANEQSQLSTTPEQKRLWQQAADQKQAPGLTNLDQGSQPVQARQLLTAADQAIPPQGTGLIEPNVKNAVRIVETAGLQDEYGGSATVKGITNNGEQLLLDLGNNRSVMLQARVDGKALLLMPNAAVTIDYRVRNDESNRRQIFALSGPNGVGVARVSETGPMPIAVSVPLFLLDATQSVPSSGRGGRGGPAQAVVNVRVAGAVQTLTSGQTVQFGGVTVTVLGSRSPTGTRVDRLLEGGAYSLELIAWR